MPMNAERAAGTSEVLFHQWVGKQGECSSAARAEAKNQDSEETAKAKPHCPVTTPVTMRSSSINIRYPQGSQGHSGGGRPAVCLGTGWLNSVVCLDLHNIHQQVSDVSIKV